MPKHAPLNEDSRLYLIDGSAYIFRAFHALPPLTRKSDGMPIGAVSGFCNMLWKLLSDASNDAVEHIGTPTHFAVIFDHSSYSFRNDLYADYKANRDEPPEDLRPQFSVIRDATRAFGLPCKEEEGFEADDIIATYAREASERGAEVVIVSSDKDLTQLVTDKVVMFDPMKNKIIDTDGVIEKFGVGPEKMIDLQALMGDSTDNVPGVPGIGPKTAATLLDEYGTLEELLERAEEIKQKKRRETIIENADAARISKKLVTLDAHMKDIEGPEEFGLAPFDHGRLVAFLEEMEFSTLTRRVRDDGGISEPKATPGAAPAADSPIDPSAYKAIFKMDELEAFISRAQDYGTLAVDTETDSLNAMRARLVGICLAAAPGDAIYIPLLHGTDGLDLGDSEGEKQLDTNEVLDALEPIFNDLSVMKVGQNLKYDLVILNRHGATLSPCDDTMLMSYVLENGQNGHGMDELAEKHLSHGCIPFTELAGKGKAQKTFDQIPIPDATKYAAEDADVTQRLGQTLKGKLIGDSLLSVYERIERPLVPVIANMEREGIKVDREELSRLSSEFAQKMAMFEDQAHEAAGEKFNLGSPKQIGEILFGKLGLPGGKKTKTGAWSTSADLLDELAAEGHEVPKAVLGWRQMSKLKSTYADALVAAIHPETGRVHTSFSLATTTTGRLSSNDPNLQNIPIRTEEGRKIRKAFIAEKGNLIVSADYSQIELRLLAHIGDVPELARAFNEGIDVHALTASEVFGVPLDEVTSDLRRSAKTINFGIIYGISAFGLSSRLGIERGVAKDYIDGYFAKFPGIRRYMDETIASARELGYTETVFGRRAHIQGITAKQPNMRAFAERQAINAPIQGTAADIVKRAMVRVPPALEKAGLKAKMLLQVHDELVLECPEKEADKVCEIVRDVMMNAPHPAAEFSVPLEVEANAAPNWEEAH
ncbi:DNA polymerase I [Parvularcula sp. ZS-1/3]|uniref:DNA polymerase I n=1 Tax=Parvularcula mediterranea TaxID=2732508 RepID=A0A7Y3RLX5_9PROT|nr:DNA polymerase I [Parvularcula mediterranea]NNU15747.1 DNA polymerase I [Parvularcula mediterranea]